MRILYVSNIDPKLAAGYDTKIVGQARGLAEEDTICEIISFDINGNIISRTVTSQGEIIKQRKTLKYRSNNLLIRRKRLLESAINTMRQGNVRCLYLRYPKSDPLYLYYLWRIKSLFPSVIIICEFPTFPYDNEKIEGNKIKAFLIKFLDRSTRIYLKKFIDKAVSINYDNSIFGISTISINNGIIVSDFPLKKSKKFNGNDIINLIGVANVKDWHGYDRVLNGLKDYYQQESPRKYIVNFHIVGAQSPYLKILQSIVNDCALQKYVIFHVPCQGEKLDSLFNISHLAIGVLGGHRKGLNVMSPLKHREYCARGIPFILSHQDPDFPLNSEYCLHFPHDDTPIKINILIDFYLDKCKKHNSLSTEMRLYAKQNLDWSIKLKPVKLYVESSLTQTLC